MKKLFALIIAGAFCLAFSGCKSEEQKNSEAIEELMEQLNEIAQNLETAERTVPIENESEEDGYNAEAPDYEQSMGDFTENFDMLIVSALNMSEVAVFESDEDIMHWCGVFGETREAVEERRLQLDGLTDSIPEDYADYHAEVAAVAEEVSDVMADMAEAVAVVTAAIESGVGILDTDTDEKAFFDALGNFRKGMESADENWNNAVG